jgi:two-component system, cell cycle response regulator
MPRKSHAQISTGRIILLVDDNREYLDATRVLLEREGHKVLCAADGPEALRLLQQQPEVDLLLLDYYMPGMTGEETVTHLRQFNPYVQIILQTGYASEQPPRELLKRLEIQGYYDKGEGPEKLLLWVDVGLKAAYAFQLISKSRQGLRYILDITPELHKIQPLEELLQGILLQVSGLLGAVNSFLAVLPRSDLKRAETISEGFVAIMEDGADLIIRASTGRFSVQSKVSACLESEKIQGIRLALQSAETQHLSDSMIIPLSVGRMILGAIFLDRVAHQKQDLELIHIFANQAAVAIQNTQLYEMATLDPLTGSFVRGFFEKCLLRELRAAFRSQKYLCLVMLDIDEMKSINDTAGHQMGDRALATLGAVLREVIRATDIVGRYGGDEFIIVLPLTTLDGMEAFARRIYEGLAKHPIASPTGDFQLKCSMGVSELKMSTDASSDAMVIPAPQAYFQSAAQALIRSADEALYQAKHSGGNKMVRGEVLDWLDVLTEAAKIENRAQDEQENPLGWK